MSYRPFRRFVLALALVLFAAPVQAAPDAKLALGSLAVLDFPNKIAKSEMSAANAQYFADVVRGVALKELPNLKVITRENLLVLLQATGKDLASCEGECEVDTGRRIGADLIISGDLLKVGTSYKLNLRLHETHGGAMLSGEIASGHSIDELDANTKAAVSRLLAPLKSRQAQPLIASSNNTSSNNAPPLIQDRDSPASQTPQSAPPSASRELALPEVDQPAATDTNHRHLGFQFHGDLGLGYLSTSEGDVTISGAGGAFGIEAGYAVWENTLLGLRISDSVAISPTVSTSGGSQGTSSDASVTSVIVAPTITHYFMPLNLFVSGSIGVSTLSFGSSGTSSSANAGLGVRAAIGKEWWVSDHWGIGGVFQVTYAENGDTNGNLSTVAAGIAFSATWN
jgi:hypothetical protein